MVKTGKSEKGSASGEAEINNTEKKREPFEADRAMLADSCGRGVKLTENGEFLSMRLSDYRKETENASGTDSAGGSILSEFLDEPFDAEMPEALEIDPALAAEWEQKLSESFKNNPITESGGEPAFHAVRKRRPHKKQL